MNRNCSRPRRRTTLAVALASMALQFGPLYAEEPITVESQGLGRTVLVRGQLGQPLGKLIDIEGRAVERDFKRFKAQEGLTLFRVSKVNGQALAEPVVISLSFFGFLSIKPPAAGEKRTFRGYEDGRFEGIPNAAIKEMTVIPATADWHFSTTFWVIK